MTVPRQGRPPVRRRRRRRRQLPGRGAGRRFSAFALPRTATRVGHVIETRASIAAVVAGAHPAAAGRLARAARKRVLAWADVRNGYQHDSISHAVATIERLGRESGAYDTFIRTDSQLITEASDHVSGRHRHRRPGESSSTSATSNYFDAIFFFGVREIDLSAEQRADLLSFVKDDGKGFVAAHSAATAFFSWPEFGEMLGGRFDEHPWGIADGTVVVDDPAFPAMRHLPRARCFTTSSIRSRISRATRFACSRTSTPRSWI